MPRRLRPNTIQEVYELAIGGYNPKKISLMLGIAHSTAIKYCRRDVESDTSYRERLLLKNGGGTLKEHKNALAREKGFESDAQYQKITTEIKRKKAFYQKLSLIVSRRTGLIQEREKIYQSEIAEDCGLSKQTFSAIKLGKFFPEGECLEKLCSGLNLKKSALEKILKSD